MSYSSTVPEKNDAFNEVHNLCCFSNQLLKIEYKKCILFCCHQNVAKIN